MWLETLTVRTPMLAQLEAALPTLLNQLSMDAPDLPFQVYARYPANSDLSLQFAHTTNEIKTSDHGLRMAAALSQFGTVDHALWQSVHPTQDSGEANND